MDRPVDARLPGFPFAWRRGELHALLVVLAVALIYRVLLAITAEAVSNDAAIFSFIVHLAHEHGLVTAVNAYHQNPGYPALIALAMPLVHAAGIASSPFYTEQIAGQLVAIVAGVVSTGCVWWLARALLPATPAAGWMAALIYALLPQPARFAADMLSDVPAWGVYATGLVGLIAVLRERRETGVVARLFGLAVVAVLAAAAFYIRMEAGGLIAVAAISVLACAPGSAAGVARWRVGTRVAGVAVLGVCFAAAVVPFVLATGKLFVKKELIPAEIRTHGRLEMSPLRLQQDDSRLPAMLAAQEPTVLSRLGFAVSKITQQIGRGLQVVWLGFAIGGVAAYLVHRGYVARRREPPWPPIVVDPLVFRVMLTAGVIQTAAVFRLALFEGYVADRHVLPLIMLVLPWAALGVAALAWQLTNRHITRLPKLESAARVTVLLAGVLIYVAWLVEPLNAGRAYVAEMGRWMRANHATFGPGAALTDREWFAYYAGRSWARSNFKYTVLEYDQLLAHARDPGVAVVLLDPSNLLARFSDGRLKTDEPRLFERLIEDRFELVARFPGPAGDGRSPPREVRVYRPPNRGELTTP